MGDPLKMDGVVIIIYNMIMEHPIKTWMGVPPIFVGHLHVGMIMGNVMIQGYMAGWWFGT